MVGVIPEAPMCPMNKIHVQCGVPGTVNNTRTAAVAGNNYLRIGSALPIIAVG